MVLQVVDHSGGLHALGEVAALVSPKCRCQPPTPLPHSYYYLAKSIRQIHGVDITDALLDQLDLGLPYLDSLLLYSQLPLGDSWIAKLMPSGEGAAKCVAPWPDPITAAIALASTGVGSLAVDLRFGYERYAHLIAEYAESVGAELQLLVTRPLNLPGDVVFHSSVPPYLRERYIKAVGDVSISKGAVQLGSIGLGEETCSSQQRDFAKALERVAMVLGLDMGIFDDLVSQGVLSQSYLQDFADPRQLGYLVKWDIIRQTPGGWLPTPKLVYLYGLYKSR
ncbi:hypothetical protein [Pyrobaculum ferrireducens]|uniref:hypothetical protein n=1 Tax=Pyrobaculum ferrireducens TaxID=1104324 RepID=UPI0011E54D52|nr:hypothetical protein [Pyrobaculum ferrireducens]